MPDESQDLPRVTFSNFVLSLASSAMVHLGETADPSSGQRAVDLDLARHTIDVLGVLEDKTAGNLNDEEQRLLASLLADLRSRFVQASRAQG